jgi:hypothetical protein
MISRTALRALAAPSLVICCLLTSEDPFVHYFERKDGVTLGAGNAKSINSATHIIDPWNRNVGNTRIAGNGQRMTGAMERYRDVTKLPQAAPPIATEYGVTTNIIGNNSGAK